MAFNNLVLIIIVIVVAGIFYWLMRRLFEQTTDNRDLEKQIATLNNEKLEREMEFQQLLVIEIREAKKKQCIKGANW